MNEQSEVARMNGTCPSACSVWAVFRPDGTLSDIDGNKGVALARAVAREGYSSGWVDMAPQGWTCIEGQFTPNDMLTVSGGPGETT